MIGQDADPNQRHQHAHLETAPYELVHVMLDLDDAKQVQLADALHWPRRHPRMDSERTFVQGHNVLDAATVPVQNFRCDQDTRFYRQD